MDKENELAENKDDTAETENDNAVKYKKSLNKKSLNLLKRSKHDLLRLLSILEGELEARDIFISTLQAQISNQRNARQQYFVHRLTDPFLALHRDDYASGNASAPSTDRNGIARIEPLPLLEKVVYQFKTQQQKMHQQMSLASKIHRKMAHELAEEKRKHAVDTKTGDDVTMALEKERERLKASVLCERSRTKRIESEYKKLLELCKQDRKKHKMIVLMLLEEQQRLVLQLKESRELQIDHDSSETKLQARLHEALKEKHELATRLREQHAQCNGLKSHVRNLQEKVDRMKMSQRTSPVIAPSSKPNNRMEVSIGLDAQTEVIPELPVKASRLQSRNSMNGDDDVFMSGSVDKLAVGSPPILGIHHPMSVAQSSQDVTLVQTSSHPPILLADGVNEVTTSGYYSVKPGLSIAGLDVMKSTAQNKQIFNMDLATERGQDVVDGRASEQEPRRDTPFPNGVSKSAESLTLNLQPQPPNNSVPPKPSRFVPGSTQYPPLRSPHSFFMERNQLPMASSPTSGAANFAMNSPNSPTPPMNSPFSLTRSNSVKASNKAPPVSHDGSSKTSPQGRNKDPPPVGRRTSQFQAARQKFQSSTLSQFQTPTTIKKEIELKKVTKENIVQTMEDKKFQVKKFTATNYKSQITQKVSPISTSFPNVPKQTKVSSPAAAVEPEKIKPLPPKNRPATTPPTTSDQVRPPPLPPKKPSLSDKTGKRVEGKRLESPTQRKATSVKRPVALANSKLESSDGNSNNNNNNNKRVKAPVPPSLPLKKSSQSIPPGSPRHSLSAQQRLFPSTGGASVQESRNATSKKSNAFAGK